MDQTIARVAEALGFQAARIWPQVVMVTWLTSLFWAIVDPLLLIASVIGIIRAWRSGWRAVLIANHQYEADWETRPITTPLGNVGSQSDYDPTPWVLLCVIAAGCLALVAFFALLAFPDQLAGAVYPEATTVLRIAKGLK